MRTNKINKKPIKHTRLIPPHAKLKWKMPKIKSISTSKTEMLPTLISKNIKVLKLLLKRPLPRPWIKLLNSRDWSEKVLNWELNKLLSMLTHRLNMLKPWLLLLKPLRSLVILWEVEVGSSLNLRFKELLRSLSPWATFNNSKLMVQLSNPLLKSLLKVKPPLAMLFKIFLTSLKN